MMYIIVILFAIMILLLLFNFKNINADVNAFTNNKGRNVVLIGDSMLNNSNYVSQGESVPDLLSNKLVGNTVYNFAKDGATISDCYAQIDKIPIDSNNIIFVSCGGNNILNSRGQNLNVTKLFAEYSELIKSIKVRAPNANLYVLNLYMPAGGHHTSYKPAIDQWNQLLQNNASTLGYNVLTTDDLLTLNEDFIYGVEPSFNGGKKLVSKMVSVL
jgi:hypothetical protein